MAQPYNKPVFSAAHVELTRMKHSDKANVMKSVSRHVVFACQHPHNARCFEALNIDGIKRLWGRKISDLAFYQFIKILKYKSIKHDRQFLQVGQWTATTKPCSDCGHHNENLQLNDRQWICQKCDALHDRDINAAINISQAGVAA